MHVEEAVPCIKLQSVFKRMGHSSTRMTLDTYGHVLAGAQREATSRLQEIFEAKLPLGVHLVVNRTKNADARVSFETPVPSRDGRFRLVEMSGFEPLTPYMRSKCSTS